MTPLARSLDVWACLALTGLLLCNSAAAQDPPPSYPQPDEFFGSGRLSEYVRQAKQFLLEDPRAEVAPRVAFDLLMVATVSKDARLADEMKAGLVLEYPGTLYAKYALATLGDASDYRDLLKGLLEREDDAFSEEFARQYCRAVAIGIKQWGEQLLSGDTVLLQSALMAHIGGDHSLEVICLPRLAAGKDPARQIAQIAFGSTENNVDKIVELHQIDDNQTARLYERFYYSRLSAEQRELPQIVKLIAENHLGAGEFSEALPLIERLAAGGDDPQVSFWLGWCRAALGHTEQALATLAKLEEQHPQSPWSKRGSELSERVEGLEQNLEQYAEALLGVVAALRRDEIGAVEGTVVFRRDDGQKVDVYVGLIPQRNYLEIVIRHAGGMALGYKTTDRRSKVFFQGEPLIHGFEQKAFYPAPRFALNRDGDGKFSFNVDLQFSRSSQGIAQAGQALFDSPFLADKAGVLTLLKPLAAKGWLPTAVQTTDAGTSFTWVRPLATGPETEQWQYRIAADGELQWLKTDRITCTDLRYGLVDSFDLSPPAWPDMPVVQKEEMDAGALFRLMGAAVTLFGSEKSVTASKAAPTRR